MGNLHIWKPTTILGLQGAISKWPNKWPSQNAKKNQTWSTIPKMSNEKNPGWVGFILYILGDYIIYFTHGGLGREFPPYFRKIHVGEILSFGQIVYFTKFIVKFKPIRR